MPTVTSLGYMTCSRSVHALDAPTHVCRWSEAGSTDGDAGRVWATLRGKPPANDPCRGLRSACD